MFRTAIRTVAARIFARGVFFAVGIFFIALIVRSSGFARGAFCLTLRGLLPFERRSETWLLFVDLWKIVEAARKNDRRRVCGRGLPTATTTAASATLTFLARTTVCTSAAALGVLVVFFDFRWETRERRHMELLRLVEINIGAAIVVGVDVDTIDRDGFADAHVDLLREEIFELDHCAALSGKKDRSHLRRTNEFEPRDALHVEDELHAAQCVARDALGHANLAVPRAMWAVHVVRLAQAWPHALARQFENAELADLADGGLRAIAREVLLETLFDFAAMLRRAHIDEVANHDAAKIAQSQLPRDFIDRLLIRLIRIGLAVARAARATRVDVDRHERFGLIEHQRASRGKRHFACMNQIDLSFHIKRVKDRSATIVEVNLCCGLRRDDLEERACSAERALAIDHDAVDRGVDRIANRAQENVALCVQLAWRTDRVHALLHHLPKPREVLRVARKFRARRIEACRSQDEAEALRKIERIEDLPHLSAAFLVVDFARHADVIHIGHHHEQATWNRQVARNGWALRAEAFLEHLHGDLLPALECLLHHRTRATWNLAADFLGAHLLIAVAIFIAAMLLREVLRMQVGDVEEAVRPLAEIDECGLNSRLHVDDARLVDRADVGRGRGALGEELREFSLLENRDARLFARNVVHDDELLWLLTAMRERVVFAIDRRGFVCRSIEIAHRGARVGSSGIFSVGSCFCLVAIVPSRSTLDTSIDCIEVIACCGEFG